MGIFTDYYRNKTCSRCGSELPETGRICPHCHEEVGYTEGPTTFSCLLMIIGLAFIIGIIQLIFS